MKKLQLLLLIFVLAACKTTKTEIQSNVKTDKVIETVTEKDSLIADTTKSVTTTFVGETAIIEETETITIYDTSKENNPVQQVTEKKRKATKDSSAHIVEEEEKGLGILTSETMKEKQDVKVTEKTDVTEEQSTVLADMMSYVKYGVGAFVLLLLLYISIRIYKRINSIN